MCVAIAQIIARYIIIFFKYKIESKKNVKIIIIQDKLKCACFQETLRCYHPDERRSLKRDENIGYDFRRLPYVRQNLSGIYECNAK
jgi:hypothetical protein